MYKLCMRPHLAFVLLLFFAAGCSKSPDLIPQPYDPPGSTLTEDKEITFQSREVFGFGGSGVFFSNDFAGGRLLEVEHTEGHAFSGHIRPENEPINNSAWYAFSAWSTTPRSVDLTLNYTGGTHRYWPKQSTNKVDWQPLDSSQVSVTEDKSAATFTINLGPDTLWIAGQELITNEVIDAWRMKMAEPAFVKDTILGNSRQGRPIHMLEITETPDPEAYILVIGRQHPPEISGSHALMPFIETLTSDTERAKAFRSRFAVWAVPLVNPDGVAEGHWRHNTGGVDLNRDWTAFNQPETRLIRDQFLQLKEQNKPVLAGIDFHSTWYDIMYTIERDVLDDGGFTDAWLDAIRAELPDYTLTDDPGPLGSPISKTWFYETFGAPGFTYEVGDETDRALIREVAVTAAETLMELVLEE